jgi:hypothetical protein
MASTLARNDSKPVSAPPPSEGRKIESAVGPGEETVEAGADEDGDGHQVLR